MLSEKLKKSRAESIKRLAEINKQEIIERLTQYYMDFMNIYGIIDVSPVNIATMVFERHKKEGLLNEINEPIKNIA